jgi:hypothetical protein
MSVHIPGSLPHTEGEMTFEERITKERERQRAQWGDQHDDGHSVLDWTAILCMETAEFCRSGSLEDMKRELVHVAAVARAAYESIERGGQASGW